MPAEQPQTPMISRRAALGALGALAGGAAVFATAGCAPQFGHPFPPSGPPPDGWADNPMWGVVLDSWPHGLVAAAQIDQMRELGVGYAKYWLGWNLTEPKLAAYNAAQDTFGVAGNNQPTDLTRALVADHPEWVDQYAFPERPDSPFHGLIDWSSVDAKVDQLHAVGITPFPTIGDATSAPGLSVSGGMGKVAPEALQFVTQGYVGIGREAYLAHIELYVAGAARRYSEPGNVTWWNLENELNITGLHATVFGWRNGFAWLDATFHTELIATLARGMKRGSTAARGTHNVSPLDPNWQYVMTDFAPHLDALGFGSYPNYLFPFPMLTNQLIDAVKWASTLGKKLGKPVFVMETGYASGPESIGWNEQLQAEYVSTAPVEAIKAGASAYFHFMLNDRPDWNVPDTELMRVEGHYGLVRLDGTHKPSFAAFQQIIAASRRPPSTATAPS